MLPAASFVSLTTVNGAASSPLSPLAPFGTTMDFPSLKLTLISPFACGSVDVIVIDLPSSPFAPVAPVSPLSPLEIVAVELSLK